MGSGGSSMYHIEESKTAFIDSIQKIEKLCVQQREAIEALHYSSRTITTVASATSRSRGGSDPRFVIASKTGWNNDLQRIVAPRRTDVQTLQNVFGAATKCLKDFEEEVLGLATSVVDGYTAVLSGDGDAKFYEPATDADVLQGRCITMSLLSNPESAKLAHKETAHQRSLLAAQLMLFPGRVPLAIHPRVTLDYRGYTVVAESLPPFTSSTKNNEPLYGSTLPGAPPPDQHVAVVLAMVGDALHLSKYSVLNENGDEEYRSGPKGLVARRGSDGRLYIENAVGLFPHFPPARGIPLEKGHNLFLRPEFIAQYKKALSPGAFAVLGTKDSADHSKRVRAAATNLCQVVVPAVAARLVAAPPATCQDLVNVIHSEGVNVGLLAVVLAHVPKTSPVFSLIVTEMAARAARDVIRARVHKKPDRDDSAYEFSEVVASFCSADSRQEFWDSYLFPTLRTKFVGVGVLDTEVEARAVQVKAWMERVRELFGVVFAKGVTHEGSSPFHFSVDQFVPHRKQSTLPWLTVDGFPSVADGWLEALAKDFSSSSAVPKHAVALPLMLATGGSARVVTALLDHRDAVAGKTSYAYFLTLLQAGTIVASCNPPAGTTLLQQAVDGLGDDEFKGTEGYALAVAELGAAEAQLKGQFGSAVKRLNNGIQLLDALAPNNIDSIKYHTALAALYEHRGLHEEAESHYRSILETVRAVYGPEHVAISNAISDLAVCLFTQQMFSEAAELFKEDLEMSEKLLGKDHIDVASALNNLACLHDQLEEYDESEPLYKRDIEISIKALGPSHPDVATSRNNLASCYAKQERYEEAEEEYRLALAIRKQHFGASHVVVAETLNNVGALLKDKGDRAGAKRYWEDALAMYQQNLSHEQHHRLRQCLENIRGLCADMGLAEEAQKHTEKLTELKRNDNEMYRAQQNAVANM